MLVINAIDYFGLWPETLMAWPGNWTFSTDGGERDLGNFGDFLGGALTPLLTFLTFLTFVGLSSSKKSSPSSKSMAASPNPPPNLTPPHPPRGLRPLFYRPVNCIQFYNLPPDSPRIDATE